MPGNNEVVRRQFVSGSVIAGVLCAIACCVVGSLVYAIVVSGAPLWERHRPFAARCIMMTGAFLGGLLAGRKSDRTGWLHGAATGLVYALLMILVAVLTSAEPMRMSVAVQRAVLTLVVSALGGVAGVNL